MCNFNLISYATWIVSEVKMQFIRQKIKIYGNYLNFLQFPNSKKNSFFRYYMRTRGMWSEPNYCQAFRIFIRGICDQIDVTH